MTSRLSVPGALPVSPLRFGATPVTDAIRAAVETSILTNSFGAVSGPTGTSKTSTSALAAVASGTPCVYVNITARASARQNLVNMFEAVSGTPAQGSAAHIQSDLHDHLIMNPTTMLVDEAHLVGREGLILIKGLFDLITTTRGQGTPIILVGNTLAENLVRLPELVSRINGRTETRYLTSAEVVDTVHVMEPRTRLNDQEMLFNLNKAYFKSNFHDWDLFFRTLNEIGGHSLTEPYAERHIKETLIRQGHRKNVGRA